jgi:hypothetical protein
MNSGETVTLPQLRQGENTAPDRTGTSVANVSSYHIASVFTGAGVGEIFLEVSVDNKNWSEFPGSRFEYPPVGGNNHQWLHSLVTHKYLRVSTDTGGGANGQIETTMFKVLRSNSQ